jgi:cation diffusion facilitator family transporter
MTGYAGSLQRVLGVVLVGNLSVAAAKLLVGFRAGALSVMADGVDSGVDAVATVVLLAMVRVATRPPDEDHPYGHRRFETVGAFALSGLLFLMAYEVLRAAFRRLLFEPAPPEVTPLLVGVVVASVLVNLVISTYEHRRGEALDSPMLHADAAHTRGDVYAGLGILAGLALVHLGYGWADPLVAVGVAGFIAYTGYQVFRDAVPVLTDRAVYDPQEVRAAAEAVDGVEDAHDIRSRGRPGEAFIQLHLLVTPDRVEDAHDVTRSVEERLMEEFGAREVFCHVEPEDHGRPDVPEGSEAASAG